MVLQMAKKQSLNAKRLSKQQVQKLIKSEGRLHEKFTKFFEEAYSTGYKNQPQVYELPNNKFLFVFDHNGCVAPGRGDIYSQEYLLLWIRQIQKVREDYANNRGSSIEHWIYYSKHKAQLVNKIDELIEELTRCIGISHGQLDFSYKSLDIVSSRAKNYGLENVQGQLYDNLVAYAGEVMRRRVKGYWAIREAYPGWECPAVSAKEGELMPINVVWQELGKLDAMNLRQEAANEVRRFLLKYRSV